MSHRGLLRLFGAATFFGPIACWGGSSRELAARGDTVDVLHGVEVPDPYRWLEDGDSRETKMWDDRQTAHFARVSGALPQRDWLYGRFQHLWRYDDESVPSPCLLSDRIIYWTKRADQDKWVVHLREKEGAEGRVLIDPNTWEETETLAGSYPSPDCSWAAFGKAKAGNEEPVLYVMNLETLEVLPDTLRGWKQRGVSWLHDNSGFFFSSHPAAGEVPDGEEFYWHRVWFHRLGSAADDDRLTFASEETKELFHGASVSEDGRWLVLSRGQYYKRELWLKDLESDADPVPIVGWRDSDSRVDVVDDTILITTDWHAPNYRVMSTTVDRPGRDHWQTLIPESADRLMYINPVGGRIYAVYQHNAATRIAVFERDGRHLEEIELPTIGSASVWGYWSRPTVWLSFSSFAHPTNVFTYDVSSNGLLLYKESPIDIDPSGIVVEQVWYPSRDGTRISMFLIHREDAPRDGSVPYMLTGYGGFNVSMTPRFSTGYAVWTEAGGGVAIPNLRGGGEYGQRWHDAGMLKNKQNVFDDFIVAADWLIANDYTRRERLAISGGSNGGLLVSAAITQRPDLCAAVLCSVPLTDMVRYHTFEYANVWAEEYGSADDPEMFEYLLGYSPYHNLIEGTDYPAMLIVASVNDARTNPAHARKFAAAARWADVDHGTEQPIFYFLREESGHGGGVTIDRKADQVAREWGFLMDQLGMQLPSG